MSSWVGWPSSSPSSFQPLSPLRLPMMHRQMPLSACGHPRDGRGYRCQWFCSCCLQADASSTSSAGKAAVPHLGLVEYALTNSALVSSTKGQARDLGAQGGTLHLIEPASNTPRHNPSRCAAVPVRRVCALCTSAQILSCPRLTLSVSLCWLFPPLLFPFESLLCLFHLSRMKQTCAHLNNRHRVIRQCSGW